MFYAREKPWHGLGTEVREAPASAGALTCANTDWEGIQKDVYTEDGSLVAGCKANLRGTDNAPFGIVSDRYKAVRNEEFTDGLLGAGAPHETAGALRDSRKVWMLFRRRHRRFRHSRRPHPQG